MRCEIRVDEIGVATSHMDVLKSISHLSRSFALLSLVPSAYCLVLSKPQVKYWPVRVGWRVQL